MNKQKLNTIAQKGKSNGVVCNKRHLLSTLLPIFLLFIFSASSLRAQETTVNFSGAKKDITIPANTSHKYLTLTTVGGDGGKVERVKTYNGGKGALVKAVFEIGTGAGQLQPGSTIRYIVGGKGDSATGTADGSSKGVGGGGGTAVAYLDPDIGAPWQLLMVAGGGGGAYWDGFWDGKKPGGPGRAYIPGEEGDGRGGIEDDEDGGNFGAGAYGAGGMVAPFWKDTRHCHAGWPDGPNSGEPTGGAAYDGGTSALWSGGWGFGAGGIGAKDDLTMSAAGGGGGYTGGEETGDGSKGGTSYLNPEMAPIYFYTEERGTTSSPKNGYIIYKFTKEKPSDPTFQKPSFQPRQRIQLAAATQPRCLDNAKGYIKKGNNIQTLSCTGTNPDQTWSFDGTTIRLAGFSKCIDVKASNPNNGTNIQLYDCNDTDAQRWIYDGVSKQFRSILNLEKCMDATPTNKLDVELWDCSTTTQQKWDITGVTSVSNPTAIKNIVPAHSNYSNIRALQSADGAKAGSNIQLGEKSSTDNSIRFVFDGLQIKYGPSRDLCLTLHEASTSNGTNIELRGCSDMAAKQWIYDGHTKQIRSFANPRKCMEVETTGSNQVGSNLKLMGCNSYSRQRFEIVDK